MSTKDGDTSAQEKGSAEAAQTGPSEDMKAKFRAALDKKHAHGGKDVSDDHDRSRCSAASPAAEQRRPTSKGQNA